MNRSFRVIALSVAMSGLAACGGGSDRPGLPFLPPSATQPPPSQPGEPKITVEDLPAGSYVVSLGDANAPTIGKYYAAADGSRLLVVADGADHADQLYRRAVGEAWVAVPGSDADVSVTLLRSDAVPAAVPALESLAGNYVTQVAAGVSANFSVDAAGEITAGASACHLSGKLASHTLPGTMKLSLKATGCGALPASSNGVATMDRDYSPAKFRFVVDDGNQLADLWAFAE